MAAFSFVLVFSWLVLSPWGWMIGAQSTPPARFDGFVYEIDGQLPPGSCSVDSTITIEAFFDPVCPDSRDAWPPLKQALSYYAPRVSLFVHPFPLPYHDNAFATSRALHIVNKMNSSATYSLLELFFKRQKGLYNKPTFNMSRASITSQIVQMATEALGDSCDYAVGDSCQSVITSGFTDKESDMLTRVSFKYGCSRGVFGTPFFFVNGFALPDAGAAIDYGKWRSIIDPLIKERSRDRKEGLHYLL
ncbi:uncharacterized protein LOC127799535 [Diospyros lotus]|uniref:uncharacterized protein LOC127799535 n=1 Tax=Diospyros lotus TaxID=55363 RepID=UPI00225446AC|nr:uncharacterized protein LOC127799535 [Diospyros lotus]